LTRDGDRPCSARPRLGAVSFLYRFGSAINHHVHLHACATDGVFVPTGDGPPAFLPARLITQVDLATLTEKVRRRVVRWFRIQRDGRIACVRYVLPRHKAANWVGSGRGRKSTRPGASGVVELSPCDFLDRLADLVPPPVSPARGPPADWGELVQAHFRPGNHSDDG
jgi:hypothetical protein